MSINRHPPFHRWTEVEDAPYDGWPAVPKRRRSGEPWPDGIRDKWAAWSSMPHCRLWQPSDWEFAIDALEVAAKFYEGGTVGMAAELRNREKVMATTSDARQGLRIRYVSPAVDAPASVTSHDSYRDLGLKNPI